MQLQGVRSWRFAESIDEMLHVALYVRDAAGLDVAAGPTVPPALAGQVPDRRDVLDEEERRQASQQWQGWWTDLLADAAHLHQGPRDLDPKAWTNELTERASGTGAPPDFAGLSDRAALRHASAALMPDACRWAAVACQATPPPAGESAFGWALPNEVAEGIARDRGIGLETVRGVALVLVVQGAWWAIHQPGVVLCSATAAGNVGTAHAILNAAFESGLTS